jgi:hypothetical protein
VWLAALRRFGLLLVAVGCSAALLGLILGALAAASIERAMAISFYIFGVTLLIVAFASASRGPVRPRGAGQQLRYAQAVRWASRTELEETINLSAVLTALGLVLIVIGIAIDSRHGGV